MDPELAALASSAATALVAAWTTDAWTGAKQRLARLLGRGNDDQAAAAAAELTTAQADLAAADAAGDLARSAEVERAWQDRLRRLLAEEPTAAAELRLILGDLQQPGTANTPPGGDHIEVHRNTFHGPVQVKGVQHNRG
ncbi:MULTISPECIES: hypothetical protein [unclassified Streptomyces]|uniref:hypothetical protein n=1 Tax=unclassified Streptomyces TaxID=2593676 RepID=UPI001C2EDF9F|nr:hypothetical protein [Streptomyces sp. BV333]MBV1957733.1 hypothetical protein [Streptomyces sp. BV333]